jgi:hypothetical protein
VYGKSAPARAVFSFIAAVYFCSVALADSVSMNVKIILAVVLICQTVNLARFILNLTPRADPPEEPEELEQS